MHIEGPQFLDNHEYSSPDIGKSHFYYTDRKSD